MTTSTTSTPPSTESDTFTLLQQIERFLDALGADPHAEAMRHRARTVSRGELARRVRAVTANLAAAGLAPGDTILFGVRPSFDSIVLALAALRCGARLTFVEPGGRDVTAARYALTKPSWVIAESVFYLASSRGLFGWLARRRGLHLARLSAVRARQVRVGRWLPGVPLRAGSLADLERERGNPQPPEDAAASGSVVVFTSGTTGAPKGVVHDARSIPAAAQFTDRDFLLPSTTVMYTHKLQAFLSVLENGGRCVVAPLGWDVAEFLADVREHGVTHTFMVPSQIWELANHLAATGESVPSSLRQIYLQAAPATVPVLERVHEVLGDDVRVLCIYGMTEVAPISMIDSRDKVRDTEEGDLVGPPIDGVEVRVDERGELHVRGPNCFPGYLGHDPVDWHATGDLAKLDERGNIVLMGRAKDMLLRGGFNLYPGLYEDTIGRIDGVGACAIVGVPDAVTADEEVVLFVEPHDTTRSHDELAQHVANELRAGGARIDPRALPDRIVVVDRIARGGRSNKIDRIALRAIAADADGR